MSFARGCTKVRLGLSPQPTNTFRLLRGPRHCGGRETKHRFRGHLLFHPREVSEIGVRKVKTELGWKFRGNFIVLKANFVFLMLHL